MGRIRVYKIRFVSTGENCGKPCLVCKNNVSIRCRQTGEQFRPRSDCSVAHDQTASLESPNTSDRLGTTVVVTNVS